MNFKKTYWILSILILWAVCSIVFSHFYKVEKKLRIDEIVNHQKIHARLASKTFEQLFNKWNNVLYTLSADSNIIFVNTKGVQQLESISRVLQNELKSITRTNGNGIIMYTVPYHSELLGQNISGQNHMKKILTSHQPVVSDVFDAVQGYKAIAIHYPVFRNKKFDGTIALVLDFEKISKDILSEIEIGKSGYAWLLGSEGVELYCHNTQHLGKKIGDSPEHHLLKELTDSMIMGKEGILRIKYDDTSGEINKNIIYYLPVKICNTFWSLAVICSEEEITSSLLSFRNKLLAILAFIFSGGVFLSYFGIKAWMILRESELRKKAEIELEESKERYRIVIETTNTGYAVLDKEGKIVDANQKYTLMTGHRKNIEIIGRSLKEWIIPKEYEQYELELQKCLKNKPIQNLEIEFLHPDGTIQPVEISANKIVSGPHEWVIMLCRDITERKLAKEALIKERTLLRTLIDNLPSGVFIKDTGFRKIIANPIHVQSVLEHLKRAGMNTDVDIIGKTDFEVFPIEEATSYQTDDKKVINEGQTILNQVERGLGPHGESKWLLVSKLPLKANNGEIIGMVGITTDITEQKSTEEQLILAKEKAEQSDRLKTAFLNNISHEIRTPLNAIVGFTGLLKEPGLNESRRNHFLDIVSQSSNQLLSIITDIISIATIEAGQLKLNASRLEINSIIHILYEQYKGLAENKNIELNYVITLSDKDATIFNDGTKFLEILSNLINNAIKFTPTGSVTFGYELTGDMVRFFVKDTGIGIRKEHHESIFDRFWQVENSLSNKFGGTGLGLSISKTYVELMGGKIWLTSEPDLGTTFFFTLPFKKTPVT